MARSKSRRLRNLRRHSAVFECCCGHCWTSDDLKIQESEECEFCGRIDVYPISVELTTDVDTNDSFIAVENQRYFGQFQCYKCLRTWFSAQAWLGYGQECRTCNIMTEAHRLRELRKPQGLNKKNDPNRPHESSLCGKCQHLGFNCKQLKKLSGLEKQLRNLSLY